MPARMGLTARRMLVLASVPFGLLVSCTGGTVPTPAGRGAQGTRDAVVGLPGDEPDDENDANEDVSAPPGGALPFDLNELRTRGADFYAHFAGMPWHGHKRARDCAGCTGADKTRLRIQALSNQHKQPLTGFSANGVVVGRIRNVGSRADATTGIPGTGKFEKPDEYYYIIKDIGQRESAELWVARITFKGPLSGWRPNDEVEIKRAAKPFLKCHKDSYNAARSEGDFKECDVKARRSASVDVAWFSCDAGCCTAQWPP